MTITTTLLKCTAWVQQHYYQRKQLHHPGCQCLHRSAATAEWLNLHSRIKPFRETLREASGV